MADIFETEHDPFWNTTFKYRYRDDGKVEVTQTEDIEPLLMSAYEARKNYQYTTSDLENNANLYARIGVIHVKEMMDDKVDMTDPLEMMRWVNRKHPELRVTTKWHGDKRASKGTSRVIIK